MKTRLKFKTILFTSFFALLLLLLVYFLRLEALGWYFWHNAQTSTDQHALNLKSYKTIIDGLRINGLNNASDLTYNPDSKTLFTVLNQESKIVELSRSGKVLRFIHVIGADDMEGITHIDGNEYVIADERDNRLVLIEIDKNTSTIDIKNLPKIRLGINDSGNKNFEGVSWDNHQKRLLVVKERDPKYVISVKGLVDRKSNENMHLDIEKLSIYDNILSWAMRDLSSVKYLGKSGHMLLLSEESRLLKELDENAKPLGALALWKGFHGLKSNVPQAEGITIDDNNRIYIISEPNLFYVFEPN